MQPAKAAQCEFQLRRRVRQDLQTWCETAMAAEGLVPAAHHLLILQALRRLAEGNCGRLVLLMPPGSAKSTYVSRLFPAWWLSVQPRSSVIAACHTASLAFQFGRSVRNLLEAEGIRLGTTLRDDARAASCFATEQGGGYFAAGVGGAIAGWRADLAIVDDPLRSYEDALRHDVRERVWNWFRADLATRLRPKGRVVVAMTRWHREDLAGRLLEQRGWDVLRLPALAEPGDPLGREPGAPLWPSWESLADLQAKRASIGEAAFAALYQQAPLAASGQFFEVDKIRLVDTVPDGTVVRAWDLAASGEDRGDADWTVGVRLIRFEGGFAVDDIIRLRGDPATVVAAIVNAAEADGRSVTIGLPTDPGQAGKWQTRFLVEKLAGHVIEASPETGPKTARAVPVASQMSAGNLIVRRAFWTRDFIEELTMFPNGRKDDQVDALSRAFALVIEPRIKARFASFALTAR